MLRKSMKADRASRRPLSLFAPPRPEPSILALQLLLQHAARVSPDVTLQLPSERESAAKGRRPGGGATAQSAGCELNMVDGESRRRESAVRSLESCSNSCCCCNIV